MSVAELLCGSPPAPCSARALGTVSAQVGDGSATELGKLLGPIEILATGIGLKTALHRLQGATVIGIQTRIKLATTNSGELQPSPSSTVWDGLIKPELEPTRELVDGLNSAPVSFSSSTSTSSPSMTLTLTSDDSHQPTFTTIGTIAGGIPTVTVAPSTTHTTTVTNVQTRGAVPSSHRFNPSPSSTLLSSDSIQPDNKMKIIVPSVIISFVALTLFILSLFYWRRRARHSKYAALTPFTMGPTSRGHRNRMNIYRQATTFQGRSHILSQHSSNDSLAPLIAPFDGRAWIPRFLFKPRRVRDIEVQLAAMTHKLEALEQAIQSPAQGPTTPTSTNDSHTSQLVSYNTAPDGQAWRTGPPPKYVSRIFPLGATGPAPNSPGRKQEAQNTS